MPKRRERRYSVLIVSGSASFNASVKRALEANGSFTVTSCRNVTSARQKTLCEKYDLVIMNCPLSDEFGHDFAMDVSERDSTSVLTAVPAEVYEAVSDHLLERGIAVAAKPVSDDQMYRFVRFMTAIQTRMQKLEEEVRRANEKAEEMRIVAKAKAVLMQSRNMTEDQAHRFIGKEAMNRGVSRRKIAESILDETG